MLWTWHGNSNTNHSQCKAYGDLYSQGEIKGGEELTENICF